jgi:hypothetical protein
MVRLVRAATAGRFKRALLAFLAAATVTLVVTSRAPGTLVAFSDNDFDGIDDNHEMELAQRFFPEIRHHSFEVCQLPLPATYIFRARHPSYQGQVNTNFIAINYIRLFRYDCGPAGHDGDNEPFLVFLRWNGSDWQFDSVSATSHWGTACEVHTMSSAPLLWVGKDKHGIFADLGQCDSGAVCNNHCTWNGPTTSYQLFNVGEPPSHAWLLNLLGEVDGSFAGERVWDDENDKFFGAGHIAGQLYLGGYLHLTKPPGALEACGAQCEAQYQACVSGGGVPQDCWFEREACQEPCWWTSRWDY